ncbi:hypothetical protein AWH56_003980 [Anaerobacillus isosaccharinicus]|uniref:Uncharacterized protein n=2 Tax=Anaerobacillus isosaccharinicus TaxID=1532552 RepID=A0A7S7L9J3_9BACI|nr:hypothetical protein [Anaerobacillus isosaccharinicus]MBA5584814.1 hypothetical protein [Anaerobacillus isosaccharinicus]QOY36821.1 hypothetical protein AWH56_003980 [Anaerobacillus isosaccharinicus]
MLLCVFLLMSNLLPTFAAENKTEDETFEPLVFDEETMELLPAQLRDHLTKEDESDAGELVMAVATIHVIEAKGGKNKQIAEINYDFSTVENIKKYNEDLDLLTNNVDEALVTLGIIDEEDITQEEMVSALSSRETTHRGILTTGVSAQRYIDPNWRYYYQLQGWWNWLDSGFSSSHDRLGLIWQREFSSQESTHHAWSTTKSTHPTTTKLTKLPYLNNLNFLNKGVMWKHNTTARTEGTVTAQVYHRTNFSGMHWGVAFEYVSPGSSTADDRWSALIHDLVFSLSGLVVPWERRYKTGITITLP